MKYKNKGYVEQIASAYREQTIQSFRQSNPNGLGVRIVGPTKANYDQTQAHDFMVDGNGFVMEKALGSDVATGTTATLPYATADGFFADCSLEASVINVTINPIYSLFNILPVRASIMEKVRYAFVTQIDDPSDDFPDAKCDPSPQVGNFDVCKADFYFGRVSYRSRTLELDEIIQKAHRGVPDDLYLLGNIRGVPRMPNQDELNDRDFVQRAAVRRQLMLIGRAFQRDLVRMLWTGNPDNVATNTVGGGRREFWGLDYLIANDYDTKTFVEGTNCVALNSDIKVYDNCLGAVDAPSLYEYMEELEFELFMRASYMGLLPVNWVWAMHPLTWQAVLKHLPCQLISGSCVNPAAGAHGLPMQVQISGDNGLGIQALRQEMQNSMQVTVNGRTYPVIIDSGIPGEFDIADDTNFISNIYLIPMSVNGETVLEVLHRDYREFEQHLQPIPNTADVGLRGWTDEGRYHFIIERRMRCFEIDGKTEPALVFRAPHLAGKITGIGTCALQTHVDPFTVPVPPPPPEE